MQAQIIQIVPEFLLQLSSHKYLYSRRAGEIVFFLLFFSNPQFLKRQSVRQRQTGSQTDNKLNEKSEAHNVGLEGTDGKLNKTPCSKF